MEVPAGALEGDGYSTPALVMEDVEYTVKDNGAVTFIPPYEDEAHFIIEAEDHSSRKDFLITLNGENVTGSADPEDGTMDYLRESMTATVGDYETVKAMSRVSWRSMEKSEPDGTQPGDRQHLWKRDGFSWSWKRRL